MSKENASFSYLFERRSDDVFFMSIIALLTVKISKIRFVGHIYRSIHSENSTKLKSTEERVLIC